ncbi:transglutaminase family protein [Ornithinimicrobium cerasi]|uniref:Transglutaminase-like enzyme, putative cysteine protease n=1 Tax=Ornithinimicrobium cerasi TaxID=2248773 RepID=A0A285VQI2_9MICO|nr:transglutaminase family protein [Ornithinimicrobium cerasi]SOC56213.1 Transglutaminase-like enzyme, putative cysteine protease [Ornithinimicrobium cerasi]
MLLRVVHRTGYEYAGTASHSFNEARMTPRQTLHQQVLHTKVDIAPAAWTNTYTDYWGTTVTQFEVYEPHQQLMVTATSTVDVQRPPVDGHGLSWDALRSAEVFDDLSEYLLQTPSVEPPADLRALIAEIAGSSATPGECARQVVDLVHHEIRYVTGSTGVHTRAAEAWAGRSGVCQDMSNLTIGCLRSVGIPACYVSGYLLPAREPEVGKAYKGESHAWIRWWDGEWVGMDPTNAVRPGPRHVEVGRGREYGDVPPLRGIYTGTRSSAMFVEVELTALR